MDGEETLDYGHPHSNQTGSRWDRCQGRFEGKLLLQKQEVQSKTQGYLNSKHLTFIVCVCVCVCICVLQVGQQKQKSYEHIKFRNYTRNLPRKIFNTVLFYFSTIFFQNYLREQYILSVSIYIYFLRHICLKLHTYS